VKFPDKLDRIIVKNNSLLCIGLDPEIEKLSPRKGFSFTGKGESLLEFSKWIIDKTAKLVCAYKPNIAFFEAYGLEGLDQLKKIFLYLQNEYPQIPIILDAKRTDIANSAKMYAKSMFDYWGADATTVYPHLGLDSIEPFLSYMNNYTFLLVKTSNLDSVTFQNLKTEKGPYYLALAKEIKKWDRKNIGIFVGATYPKELKGIREIFPDKILLSAGVGAQGADLERSVKAGVDKQKKGIIFNASRSIIYAQDPAKAAKNLRDEINKYRSI